MHKPMRVTSGHSLGCQQWGDPIRFATGDAGSKEGGDCDVPHRLGMGMCLYE
jgi:hypothetical protein